MQQGDCAQRVTPASTFKIAISLMGYDAGFLKDEHSPALPFKPGYPDWLPAWRQTTDPTSWLKNSVVWYSQQITRALGEARFAAYARDFQYGNADVSGNPGKHDGLTQAWLSSSLRISPLGQISFLEKFLRRQLPVSAKAYDLTAKIMPMDMAAGWAVRGKTGMGFPLKADGSTDDAHAYGWFAGWATKGSKTFVFARLDQETEPHSVRVTLRAKADFLNEISKLPKE